MKTYLHILFAFLFFALACPSLKGENDISGNPVPADLEWESLSQGIELGWQLIYFKQYYSMKVYLKNTSNSVKDITIVGQDMGLRFFFTDSQGVQHNLHPKPQVVSPHVVKIEPSEIMTLRVWLLDPADLTFLNANLVQCSIPLHDPATDQTYTLISAPRQFSTSP